MKKVNRVICWLFLMSVGFAGLLIGQSEGEMARGPVYSLTVTGTIDPVVSEYIRDGIEKSPRRRGIRGPDKSGHARRTFGRHAQHCARDAECALAGDSVCFTSGSTGGLSRSVYHAGGGCGGYVA